MKGCEKMSGICKYPRKICGHMTYLHGKTYCNVTPCQLHENYPTKTNADQIREMNDGELAHFFFEYFDCRRCFLHNSDVCNKADTCLEALIHWLKSPTKEYNYRHHNLYRR